MINYEPKSLTKIQYDIILDFYRNYHTKQNELIQLLRNYLSDSVNFKIEKNKLEIRLEGSVYTFQTGLSKAPRMEAVSSNGKYKFLRKYPTQKLIEKWRKDLEHELLREFPVIIFDSKELYPETRTVFIYNDFEGNERRFILLGMSQRGFAIIEDLDYENVFYECRWQMLYSLIGYKIWKNRIVGKTIISETPDYKKEDLQLPNLSYKKESVQKSEEENENNEFDSGDSDYYYDYFEN